MSPLALASGLRVALFFDIDHTLLSTAPIRKKYLPLPDHIRETVICVPAAHDDAELRSVTVRFRPGLDEFFAKLRKSFERHGFCRHQWICGFYTASPQRRAAALVEATLNCVPHAKTLFCNGDQMSVKLLSAENCIPFTLSPPANVEIPPAISTSPIAAVLAPTLPSAVATKSIPPTPAYTLAKDVESIFKMCFPHCEGSGSTAAFLIDDSPSSFQMAQYCAGQCILAAPFHRPLHGGAWDPASAVDSFMCDDLLPLLVAVLQSGAERPLPVELRDRILDFNDDVFNYAK